MRRDKTGIILMAHREKKPACMRESLSISHTSHFLPAFLPIAEAKTNKKRATPKPATAISVDAIFRSDRVNPGILVKMKALVRSIHRNQKIISNGMPDNRAFR